MKLSSTCRPVACNYARMTLAIKRQGVCILNFVCTVLVRHKLHRFTATLTGRMSSILPQIAPAKDTDSTDDNRLQIDVMADTFTALLVDLFTLLPVEGLQELFTTFYEVYPAPVEAKRSMEIGLGGFGKWQRHLLDGASALSQLRNFTFFPLKLSLDEFEHQLEEATQFFGYGTRVYRQARARLRTRSDDERAEILHFCRSLFLVSTSHISFLKQLQKRLQAANAPLQFEMLLVIALVSNCTNCEWTRDGHSYGDRHLCDSLLASVNIASSLERLKDMWKFSIPPERVVCLLEAIQDQVSPQLSDIICDILLSALECKAPGLHVRIFALMRKIGSKPGQILEAVDIASCTISGNHMNGIQRRTTVIQCAEALGKLYNQEKALGAPEETLSKFRIKAVDLLHHARSIPVAGSVNQHGLGYLHRSFTIDVQSMMQIVCDSGIQALADILALMVMVPGNDILPCLKEMNSLCNSYFKDTRGGHLKMHPLKEIVASLLERRKSEIITLASSQGETSKMGPYLDDLRRSFHFLGESPHTFEQDLASALQKTDGQGYRQAYSREYDRDDLRNTVVMQHSFARVRVRRMGLF